MADPTIGLTVHEVAQKLMEPETPPETVETPPEVESSEVVEETTDTSEEVVEAVETTETVEETADGEIDESLVNVNEFLKDRQYYETLKVPLKVNGVDKELSLAEITANQQIFEATQERLESAKAREAEAKQKVTTAETAYTEQLTQAANLVSSLEQQLLGDAEGINWQELRDTDPAEYSAKRLDFEKKQQDLAQAKVAISQEQQVKVNDAYNRLVAEQATQLTERIPDWADDTKAQAEKADIREYLLGSGWSQLEVDGEQDAQGNIKRMGVVDARAIAMARKAMLYDRGEQSKDVTKKKVKKLPKVAKPGKPVTSQEVDTDKMKAMRGRLKKSGRVEDAAAILKQRMFGG